MELVSVITLLCLLDDEPLLCAMKESHLPLFLPKTRGKGNDCDNSATSMITEEQTTEATPDPPMTEEQVEPESTPEKKEEAEEWTELMGPDLQMKVRQQGVLLAMRCSNTLTTPIILYTVGNSCRK